MKILIVSAVYDPEPIISAQTSKQLAKTLKNMGYAVEVITNFPNRPAGKIYAGYSRRFYQNELDESGIKIRRCYTSFAPRSTLLSRFLENFTFGVTSTLAVLTTRQVDVIYANTWPLFASFLLIVAASLKRIPVVMSIQDIYPESLLSQNRLSRSSSPVYLMRIIDKYIAQKAQSLIFPSSQFATLYHEDRLIPKNKINVIYNWVDSQFIIPNVVEGNSIRLRHNIPSTAFLVVYGGNIGVAAGVENIIEVFLHWRNAVQVYFLIAGAGSNLNMCQDLVETLELTNVKFQSPWIKEETSALLAAANVLVLPTRGEQSLVSLPSKLINYMLAARPIIAQASINSELAKIILESGVGWVIPPDQPQELRLIIEKIQRISPDVLFQMGQKGREYALKHFTTESCLPKLVKSIQNISEIHK